MALKKILWDFGVVCLNAPNIFLFRRKLLFLNGGLICSELLLPVKKLYFNEDARVKLKKLYPALKKNGLLDWLHQQINQYLFIDIG